MSKILQHKADISIALGIENIRVEAPIPGKKLVGVEVPSSDRKVLEFKKWFIPNPGTLNIPIGVNVFGELISGDLSAMPHLLIAGTTGSGKSVMISSIIQSLIDQNSIDDLQLILIDPKRVELNNFKNCSHLKLPIVYDELESLRALTWICKIMDHRYEILSESGEKNVKDFNKNNVEKIPNIVIVIDELADLMTRGNKKEVEDCIVRLSQLARAAGIHMVLATQRPTVQVVTGNIKANMPTRISFFLPSAIDSKTIIDESGAELLMGKGDMLYMNANEKGLMRLQGLI